MTLAPGTTRSNSAPAYYRGRAASWWTAATAVRRRRAGRGRMLRAGLTGQHAPARLVGADVSVADTEAARRRPRAARWATAYHGRATAAQSCCATGQRC